MAKINMEDLERLIEKEKKAKAWCIEVGGRVDEVRLHQGRIEILDDWIEDMKNCLCETSKATAKQLLREGNTENMLNFLRVLAGED